MRPGDPLPAHLIDQGCVIQAKFGGGAFRAAAHPTNSFECAESECVRKFRRVVAAGDVMTVPNKKAVWACQKAITQQALFGVAAVRSSFQWIQQVDSCSPSLGGEGCR